MYIPVGRCQPHVLAALLKLAAEADLTPGPGGSRITPVGRVTIDTITGDGRIVGLEASSQLVLHADPPIPGTRYHVPLVLNRGCWVHHDGAWQTLDIGVIYEMDPAKPHGAVNWGATRRLQLMVDT